MKVSTAKCSKGRTTKHVGLEDAVWDYRDEELGVKDVHEMDPSKHPEHEDDSKSLCGLCGPLEYRLIADALLKRPKSIYNAERILAFSMARHRRLGADSPARILSKDVIRYIYSWLNQEEAFFVIGGHMTRMSMIFKSPISLLKGQLRDDFWKLNLLSGAWKNLPSLPRAIGNPSVCMCGDEELWVMCGYIQEEDKMAPNYDAFVFSFQQWRWLHLSNLLDDGYARSEAAIYMDNHGWRDKGQTPWSTVFYTANMSRSKDDRALLLVCAGSSFVGRESEAFASPDLALLIPSFSTWEKHADSKGFVSEKTVWTLVEGLELPERKGTEKQHSARILHLGGPLVAVASFGHCKVLHDDQGYIYHAKYPNMCCSSFHVIDLRYLLAGWKRLPWLKPGYHARFDTSLWIQDNSLYCGFGHQTVVMCPCCGYDSMPMEKGLCLDLTDIVQGWSKFEFKEEGVKSRSFVHVHELDGNAALVAGGELAGYPYEDDEYDDEERTSIQPGKNAVREVYIDCGYKKVQLTPFALTDDGICADAPVYRKAFGSVVI